MKGTLLTEHEAEVRDLTLDIVNETGATATDAARMALAVLPTNEVTDEFVVWLSGGKLFVNEDGKVALV